MIWDGSLVVRAMGRTRLASGTFRMALGLTTGERRGLAAGGALRGFQFLAQPLVFLFEPLFLFLQLLNPSPSSFAFFPRAA